MKFLWLAVACTSTLVSCAPAPLYVAKPPAGAVTSGEVPRNSLGIPVWSAIKPVPAYAANGPVRYSNSYLGETTAPSPKSASPGKEESPAE